MKTIDMRFMRYLNLFERETRVRTKNCFEYNNMIIFAVPPQLVSKAIGSEGNNIRHLSEILGKKIKVISLPFRGIYDFVLKVVEPIKFKSLEIVNNEIVINAGRQSKAALIGRNKKRWEELSAITREYFGKEVRII
jgi:transcription antitermination factor NusA-like protein